MIVDIFLWVVWPFCCLAIARKLSLISRLSNLVGIARSTVSVISSVKLSDEEKQKSIIRHGIKMVAQGSLLTIVFAGFLFPYGIWYVLL